TWPKTAPSSSIAASNAGRRPEEGLQMALTYQLCSKTCHVPMSPLSAHETTVLRREYVEVSKSAAFIDWEIIRLRASSSTSTLAVQRAALDVSLEKYKAMLSPVRRLPNEISVHIFRLCADQRDTFRWFKDGWNYQEGWEATDHTEFHSSSLDTTKSPWVLGYVCHRWRQITLSTPDLWNSVEVRQQTQPFCPLKNFCHHSYSVLAIRRFISYGARNPATQGHVNPVLKIFIIGKSGHQLHAERLPSTLALQRDVYEAIRSTFTLRIRPFAEMVRRQRTTGTTPNLPKHDRFWNLTLGGDYDVMPILKKSRFPWKRITHLTVRNVKCHWAEYSFYKILPLLENLLDSLEICSMEVYNKLPMITLRHLRTLRLVLTRWYPRLGVLLDSLTLSTLQTLEIGEIRNETRNLLNFLERSACQLKTLFFGEAGGTDIDDLAQLLHAQKLRSIRALAIRGMKRSEDYIFKVFSDIIVVLTAQTGAESVPLPQLRHLALMGIAH
ncbi:hypothetical protein V5O48_009521, partial [Marasmius crinis-equi]